MTERGHDWDTLQCRVKVKELRNAYHKAQEANHHSGAVPTSCLFYKDLDAILGGDPTSTVKAIVDTQERRPLISTKLMEISGNALPQVLGQSWFVSCPIKVLALLKSHVPSVKQDPGRVIYPAPVVTHHFGGLVAHVCLPGVSQLVTELKEWQDREKKDQKGNAAHQNEATERLLNVMEHQADILLELLTLQTKQLRTHPPPPPAAVTKLFPMPSSPPPHTLINLLTPVCTCCIPLLPHHSPALQTPSTPKDKVA
ncbi:hypothetical protein UY3_12179 [Chelonia mydas]|uniref:Uncharacterized protein n=1 Tax=Chelonia mydas TaxID=8469 RepID=M7BRJ2_CHEMY|nr:hypothetical protein UY3_12179 [Chelonia mydas]